MPPQEPYTRPGMAIVEQVEAANWETWVTSRDGVMIDVREPAEWAIGLLPGTETIRLADIPGHVDQLDKEANYLIVCRSGNRSQDVAAFLTHLGFKAANLKGGMVALNLAK